MKTIAPPDSSTPTLRLPAFTAYSEPSPESVRISERGGVSGWSDPKAQIVWYVRINTAGALNFRVQMHTSENASSRLALSIEAVDERAFDRSGLPRTRALRQFTTDTDRNRPVDGVLEWGSVGVTPGFLRIALHGVERRGATFGEIDALLLSGAASVGAHANVKERRNAASVHLGYPVEKDTRVAWFYNEIRAQTDPLWSYYMACGFHRGYFGMQVNSQTERRLIFSVWDSGNEAVDRSKVGADDRVRLLKKGDRVDAGDFGNEGTGGHSHLVYDWKTPATHRFLVGAIPDGDHTTFTGWYYFEEKKAWGLIASFRAPRDGGYLRGLYSFNEDFVGGNGQCLRRARFGPAWIGIADSGAVSWRELTSARFTCDATGRAKDRIDYAAGVESGHFFLANGGFQSNGVQYGDPLNRLSTKRPAVLETLPAP